MGKDDFLQLLVTQLSNQDPLNPMDGQQFAAQLAQFSSVEQLINLNDSMSAQAEMTGLLSQNMNNGVATGLIGKQIVASGNQVGLGESGTAPVGFELDSAANDITIAIKDASGIVVRTIQMGSTKAGTHEVPWDGRGDGGSRLPEGVYSFEVTGKDADGKAVTAAPIMKGTIDRVSFGADGILLWMGNTAVGLSAVQSVQQP
jgi:flagellar basal-body rod modification protein FlgD